MVDNGQMEDLMTVAFQKWQYAVDQGEFDLAQRYYKNLCQSPQEPEEVSFTMGLWYRQNGMYRDALDAFSRALLVDVHNNVEILYELANTYMEIERYQEAQSLYERLIDMEPELAEVRFCYGQLLSRLEAKEAARAQFCQVLRIDRNDVMTYINVAVELSALGYGEEAIDVYMQALNWEPDNYYLYSNLAVEFAELGDYDSAMYCHQRALEMNSFAADLWYNLACTYALMDHGEEGLAALEKAIALDEENKLYAESDEELANLRQMPGFWRLMNK